MAKRKIKITTQGIIMIVGVVIIIVAVILLLWGTNCFRSCGSGAAPSASPSVEPSATPTITADPFEYSTATPYEDSTATPDSSTSPSTSDGGATPSGTTDTTNVLTEPTENMKKNAKAGTTGGQPTNMRSGPGTAYDKVGTYDKGVALEIYTEVNGWYFVKVSTDNKYGYIRKDLVTVGGETSNQPTDTIKGVVTATIVAFRKGASGDSQVIREFNQGQVVYIYYLEGDYYYVEIPETGEKGYIFAEYVRAEKTVPTKP